MMESWNNSGWKRSRGFI